jgi:hypothetical protein
MPELDNIANGKEPRPRELDQFATNFSVAGEKQEKAADEQTLFLLKQLRLILTLKGEGRIRQCAES